MKKIFLPLSAVLLIATLLSACGPTTIYTQSEPPVRTITVSGTGMVTLTPDLARINIGVQTQDASAAAAMDENSLRAEALIAAIKAFGVADEDIQTSNFTISPQPVYDDYYNVIGTTYMVVNTVHVTVRDLDTLGSLLDAAFEAGANDIYGIQFDVSNRTDAVAQARLGAVEDARRQAEELAAATGVRLGEVQAISYYDSTPYPVYLEMRALTDAASSVPIEVGSMEITTTVNIVYMIK